MNPSPTRQDEWAETVQDVVALIVLGGFLAVASFWLAVVS